MRTAVTACISPVRRCGRLNATDAIIAADLCHDIFSLFPYGSESEINTHPVELNAIAVG